MAGWMGVGAGGSGAAEVDGPDEVGGVAGRVVGARKVVGLVAGSTGVGLGGGGEGSCWTASGCASGRNGAAGAGVELEVAATVRG